MLLPGLLREALPDAAIGFFLHIPFPSPDIFSILPRRDELLTGLLGADLVAFQTHVHLQQFRSSLCGSSAWKAASTRCTWDSRDAARGAADRDCARRIHRTADDDRTAAQYNDLKARYRV